MEEPLCMLSLGLALFLNMVCWDNGIKALNTHPLNLDDFEFILVEFHNILVRMEHFLLVQKINFKGLDHFKTQLYEDKSFIFLN
jgi:hypothetical protein